MNIAGLGDAFFGLFNYWVAIALMMVGFYTVISHDNLVKKLIGLNLFQTSVFILYISMGKIAGSTAPILTAGDPLYAHPLPSVLILTAIVVGVATTALGLALVVRIHEAYGSIEEDDVLVADFQSQDEETEIEAHRGTHANAEANQSARSHDDPNDDHEDTNNTGGRSHGS